MTTRLFVPAEGAVKTWLRAQANVAAIAGARIWLGTPKGPAPTGPWVTLWLVNETPDPWGQIPYSRVLIQFDCWAPRDTSTRAAAASLAAAVTTAIESLVAGTLLDSTLRCEAAWLRRKQWLPDPANDVSRYSLDGEFLVCATGA